jgi:hypothetical protein
MAEEHEQIIGLDARKRMLGRFLFTTCEHSSPAKAGLFQGAPRSLLSKSETDSRRFQMVA